MTKNQIFRSLALLFFSFFFVFGLARFSVFESNDGIASAFYSGSLTQGEPINILYFTVNIFLADIYMCLYRMANTVPWFEIAMYFYVAISLFVVLYELLKWESSFGKHKLILALPIILVLASELIIPFEYTRVAFALGIASVLLLISSGISIKRRGLLSVIFFSLCILTRPEAGVFILLIQWLATLLISRTKMLRVALFSNTLIAVLLMGYISYDRLTTKDFIKQFEPELGYQLLDRGNIVPLSSMKNAIDSAKYIGVINLITDPKYTTIEFLQSLVKENAYIGVNKELALRCYNILKESIVHSLGLFIIYLGLLILIIWQYLFKDRKTLLKILCFNLLFWFIVITVIYVIMMEFWIFSSMLVMMCFILVSRLDISSIRLNVSIDKIPFVIILTGVVMLMAEQKSYSDSLKSEIAENKKFTDKIKQKYRGMILMPGQSNVKKLFNSIMPFEKPDFSAFERVYLFDCDVLYLEENYNKYLRQECKCNASDYKDFMDFMESKRDKLRIISTQDRISTIVYYCRVVRGKDYNIVAVDSLAGDGEKEMVYRFK